MKKIIIMIIGAAFFVNTAWAEEKAAPSASPLPQETAVEMQTADDVLLLHQENKDELQAVVPKSTAIVMLGNERYLQADYQDILSRYFVKCYSQYRFPTEYGWAAQDNFRQAYNAVGADGDIQQWTPEQLTDILSSMGKEQILFLNIHDRVYKQRRHIGWHVSDDAWGAVVFLKAVLIDKNGIVAHEEFQYQVEEQHTPSMALHEAYTQCVRKLQKAYILK